MSDFSIVEYFAEHEGYRCGYCKSPDTNYSHGMWAHSLNVKDYQELIDRGWRRSGKYCYKPTMNVTCCPMYTIRCAALNYTPSKSQKKVIKRVNKFLIHGKRPETSVKDSPDRISSDIYDICDIPDSVMKMRSSKAHQHLDQKCIQHNPGEEVESDRLKHGEKPLSTVTPSISSGKISCSPMDVSTDPPTNTGGITPKRGLGADPSRPPSKKAKEIRKENKKQKLMQRVSKGYISQEKLEELLSTKKKSPAQPKSLEEFLSEAEVPNAAHHLKIKMVPSEAHGSEFEKSFEQAHRVYQAYQITIHKDPQEKCSEKQFSRFLVKGPFKEEHSGGPPCGYGSFHQQYWLDDKLIAVGVVDLLPSCVSSVYLFYDPEYSFLSLGTYSAIREIAFTRELSKHCAELQYYYMGFYVHSCPKMRYKAQFSPSSLLCPETYSWMPYELCSSKLDVAKYSRLDGNASKSDSNGQVDLAKILILHNRKVKRYPVYAHTTSNNDVDEIMQYAGLVGKKCYKKMLLFRN